MPAKKLKDYLDSKNIKYVSIYHAAASTSQRIAATSHIPGKELAKTVMLKVDGKMAMAVLPSSSNINFESFKRAAKVEKVELASELAFINLFPDCEVGAMPPFGNLYGIDVYVADSLAQDEEIAFNAGTHTELIRMAYQDFVKIVNPKVASFTR
jgi:Ala-tRNA(Pro) deacylase